MIEQSTVRDLLLELHLVNGISNSATLHPGRDHAKCRLETIAVDPEERKNVPMRQGTPSDSLVVKGLQNR